MNDEIREILELTIQFVEEELDKGTPKKDIIKAYSTQVGQAFNHIKHYITNLQQELEIMVKDDERNQETIIKLSKENERLKEENKHIFANVNDDELLRSNAMNWAEAQDYKSRKEKAVEYIEQSIKESQLIFGWNDIQRYHDNEMNELLNILNGKE